jgi:hypothetical protein
MEPVGDLLASMIEARDSLFRHQLHRAKSGRTYFRCMTAGCKAEAEAPHVQCERHLSATQQEQERQLARERSETPEARRMRLRVEAKAQELANKDGRGGSWRDRRYTLRAQQIIEATADDGEVV